MANPGNRHCANCIGALSFSIAKGEKGKIQLDRKQISQKRTYTKQFTRPQEVGQDSRIPSEYKTSLVCLVVGLLDFYQYVNGTHSYESFSTH